MAAVSAVDPPPLLQRPCSPTREHLDDPRWPAGFDLESLDPHYRLAHDMLDAASLSPPDGRDLPTRTEVFRDACRAARPRAGVGEHCCLHRPERRNPHGGGEQRFCDYSGNCGLGCATRATNTLDLNYLALAERRRQRSGGSSRLSRPVRGRRLDRADGAVTKPNRDDQRARGTR
jgi:hypothetical protein